MSTLVKVVSSNKHAFTQWEKQIKGHSITSLNEIRATTIVDKMTQKLEFLEDERNKAIFDGVTSEAELNAAHDYIDECSDLLTEAKFISTDIKSKSSTTRATKPVHSLSLIHI